MRPEVAGADLDEVAHSRRSWREIVQFLDGDVHDGDAHAGSMHVRDDRRHVLVPADQDGVAQDAGAGQGREVPLDVALHAPRRPA